MRRLIFVLLLTGCQHRRVPGMAIPSREYIDFQPKLDVVGSNPISRFNFSIIWTSVKALKGSECETREHPGTGVAS